MTPGARDANRTNRMDYFYRGMEMTTKLLFSLAFVSAAISISGCSSYRAPVPIKNPDVTAVDFAQQMAERRMEAHNSKSGLKQTIVRSRLGEVEAISFGFEVWRRNEDIEEKFGRSFDKLTANDLENLCKSKGGVLKSLGMGRQESNRSVCLNGAGDSIFGFYLSSQDENWSSQGGKWDCSKTIKYIFVVGAVFEPRKPMPLQDFKSVLEANVLYKPRKLKEPFLMCGRLTGDGMHASWKIMSDDEIAADQKAEKELADKRRLEWEQKLQRERELSAFRKEKERRELERKMAEQLQVKAVGAKVCMASSGKEDYVIGTALGTPVTRSESRNYVLSAVTERVLGDQILLRVNSIKVIGSGNRTSYADTLGGEPTYKVGQVVWDQAIKWSICR